MLQVLVECFGTHRQIQKLRAFLGSLGRNLCKDVSGSALLCDTTSVVMLQILHGLRVRTEISLAIARDCYGEKGSQSANFLLQIIHVRGRLNQSIITLMKFSYKMQDT